MVLIVFSALVLAFPIVLFGIAFSATVVATVLISAAVLVATVVLGVLLKPKTPLNTSFLTSLEQQLNPDAFRTTVLGQCPAGNDVRYWEVYGSTNFDQVIAAATHKISSFDFFYINGRQVTFAGANQTGAATGINSIGTFGTGDYSAGATTYSGALTKANVLEGQTGVKFGGSVGAGSLWTSSASMTYCAGYVLRWNYSQKALPTGIPTNTVCVVSGSPVYDPRRDSTQGGSGSHRANDNTTWEYTPADSNGVPIGKNNALQILRYLLGWNKANIQTGVIVNLDGRGVNPNDIDYAQFIAAANECETAEYYSMCSLSTGDDHNTNEGIIAAAGQGVLIDSGGLWGYYPAIDDTATIAVAFTDDDVVSGAQWVPKTTIDQNFNSIGGHFIDNSSITVYQPQPYPVILNSTYLAQDNGEAKRITLDFSSVQVVNQAQALARIALNRSRLTGQFSATFKYTAMAAQVYSCITLSFAAFGWVNKLFRVISFSINPESGIDLILREESSLVYTGGTITTYVPRSAGQVYDATQAVPLTGLAAIATAVSSDGTVKTDGMAVSWAAPPANVQSIELQFKQHSVATWTPHAGLIGADVTSIVIPNLLIATSYDFQARTWSVSNIPGAWASVTQSTAGNTTATQNQTFVQTTDPALSMTVNDGAIWNNPATNKVFMRLGGSWNFIANITGTHADGDTLFDSATPGTYTFTIPSNALAHIDIFVFGGGGGASDVHAHGGGGGGYSYTHNFAVTAGTTVLTIVVGNFGRGADITVPVLATTGGLSSVAATGLTTVQAGGGGGATNTAGGSAGNGAGGITANISGEAGDTGGAGNGGANLGTGGLGPNGGARQTVANNGGNAPGGGASSNALGGSPASGGAPGRVVILTRT